jgi:eukaryotic-like serine/threonine-protein kinase
MTLSHASAKLFLSLQETEVAMGDNSQTETHLDTESSFGDFCESYKGQVLQVGEMVADYTIVEILGQGSSSAVYLVTRENKQYALKYLQRHNLRDRKRLCKEAAVLEALSDVEGIPKLYQAQLERDDPFIVMEAVKGCTLAMFKSSLGALSPRKALSVIGPLSRILSELHKRRYIHRDLKPANVLIRESDGQVFLIDFGLVKSSSLSPESFEGPVGTPYYMSPEQTTLIKSPVGPQSDVWALGVLFYGLVTGRRPFQARSSTQLMQNIVNLDPEPPTNIDKEIPEEFEELILAALQKDPLMRPMNAGLFAEHAEILVRGFDQDSSDSQILHNSLYTMIRQFLTTQRRQLDPTAPLMEISSPSSF